MLLLPTTAESSMIPFLIPTEDPHPMAPKKQSKGVDDFSKDQAVKINDELLAVETGPQRDAVYKRHGTSKQMWIQVRKQYNLKELPSTKAGKTKAKGKPKAAAKPAPKAKAPTKKPQAVKPKAIVAAKKSSLSIESKELLIRMMSKLLDD